jgi:hypothetical protein
MITRGKMQQSNQAGESHPPDLDPSLQNLRQLVKKIAARADGRFQFKKRGQLFISAHNETLSVVPVRVCNPDRSPVGINR